MGSEPSHPALLPPGLLVHGDRAEIVRQFGALAPLQPVEWDPAGVVCAPRAGGEEAAAALDRCPLPVTRLERVPAWPEPAADMVAGWYRRSPGHLPAPEGVRELVVVPGEGFGPAGHATTAMCLAALEGLPPAPALDIGCGSGLLAQAWVRLGRGRVTGIDLDVAALEQARASVAAAGLAGHITLVQGPAERLAGRVAGHVVMANVPERAHRALLACMHAPPVAAVLSGLRPGQGSQVAGGYRRLGLRVRGVARRGGWECWSLAL